MCGSEKSRKLEMSYGKERMTDQIELNQSKLGTREYWNEFYRKEQQNFQDNEDDTGECWFNDSNAEEKMIEFIINNIQEATFPDGLANKSDISFLDIGTGNGHLLFQLCEQLNEELGDKKEGNQFHFHGIDYSPDSIQFATSIAEKKYPKNSFNFCQVDLLSKDEAFLNSHSFDILLDKGTLDAIALNQDPIAEFGGKRGMDVYAKQVARMMKTHSILLITSCNFTEKELITLVTSGTNLKVWSKIKYPNFSFGGMEGSTVVSIAFVQNGEFA
ncbi:EFM4 [Candida oxycetoniae]|uniref:Protein-lysine N-methyltransferase EFM4 n=1 Tax=Candida oxycetoniae TaxID=497107 RepID=A0AAI9SVH3_9ASCO|nr:EFM4 [Candida oxycetoniae]KAI3403707.2 EFM4 [Candida oxycetoniae]